MPFLSRRTRARRAVPSASARRGMSLVEVMVAMTLLAIVLSSLAFLAGQASLRTRKAATGTYRAALASELASRFSSMPYDSLSIYIRTDTVAAGGTSYIRRVAMSDVNGSLVTKQLKITVIPRANPADSISALVFRARPSLENVLNTP
jgi:prepilin-type N-terminal cleavage/methylation domain-containing protein